MKIKPTKYYDEYLRYYEMARIQQEECNLGTVAHASATVKDPLMVNVELYDVVQRKFAGFTQIVLDLWYGATPEHPYSHKLHAVRKPICERFTGIHKKWSLPEWLYVFILHRVAGSGINYAKKPSGYNNTILPELYDCATIEDMVEKILGRGKKTIFTSVGYQFPAFPKPRDDKYRLGGDYYLAEYAPALAYDLAEALSVRGTGNPWQLRELGEYMFDWNRRAGLRAYKFQYAAVVADIADFYPQYVDVTSPFFYGTNAVECISYLADPVGRSRNEEFLDSVMEQIRIDTGANPYDAEDVCCDFIRWIENYVRPGADYQHLDRDAVWNSSTITDHPFGRQKFMLDLGLLNSFNELDVHPSDDYVLQRAGMSVEEYRAQIAKKMCTTA